MRVYAKSDIGLVRDSNQDYCKTGSFSDGAVWAVVCDGMGGAAGGYTASSVATEKIAQMLTEGYMPDMSSEHLRELMQESVKSANELVHQTAMDDPMLRGMGTTVVCAVERNGEIHLLHAGDSRAYLYTGDCVTQITKDHSLVQEMVDMGEITKEQARVHPHRNIITRALGTHITLLTDYNKTPFISGDVLLICTDGLSDYFSEKELLEYLKNSSGEELADRLIEAAKKQGGSDNITVALIYA